MDELSIKYRESLEVDERIELSKKMQRIIHEEGAFVPTFMIPYVRMGYWRWVKLPTFHGTKRTEDLFELFSSSTGGLFWIDEDIKQQTLDAMKKNETFNSVTIIDDQFKVE